MMADRGIYHDGWYAATTPIRPPWVTSGPAVKDPATAFRWELYDLNKDWTQHDDIASENPGKLKELQALFWEEAKKYQVLPLDDSVATRLVMPRPNITAGRSEFVYTKPMTGVPQGDSPLLLNCSYNITAEIEVPDGGAE
jgi:arylsulfatase